MFSCLISTVAVEFLKMIPRKIPTRFVLRESTVEILSTSLPSSCNLNAQLWEFLLHFHGLGSRKTFEALNAQTTAECMEKRSV